MKLKTRGKSWRGALLATLAFASFAASAVTVSYAEVRQGRFERRSGEDRRERRRLVRRSVLAAWRLGIIERRRAHPERFERTRLGQFVLRGQVIAIDPGPEALTAAQSLGFRILRERSFGDLGVRILVLVPPRDMDVQEALQALRAAAPEGSFELNHMFDPSQGASFAGSGGPISPRAANAGAGVKLGMIDGGVASNHPSLSGARIVARSFAGDAPVASPHGTAVASLLVGLDDDFHGAAPGAELYAADVFGDSPDGGSAEDIAAAIGWLSQQGVTVVNISLEGPPNRLVEAVCRAAIARGMILVAAVGNGGPTNPVAYPAAYPGVVAVTAIDDRNRVYLAANRGPQVTFSAIGVSVEAAAAGDEYEVVSGTSFAAPIVAAELALLRRDAGSPSRAIEALAADAVDLGAPGRDDVYGFGRVM